MKNTFLLLAGAALLGGCVSSTKYKESLEENKSLQSRAESLSAEVETVRSSSAAKAKEAQAKIESLEKDLAGARANVRAAEDKLAAQQKEQKELKKIDDLLRSDNERLEKSVADCRAGYTRAAAKLRAALEDLRAPEETKAPVKPAKPETDEAAPAKASKAEEAAPAKAPKPEEAAPAKSSKSEEPTPAPKTEPEPKDSH
jgi:peptidoglycan hydrolase CwlO-like protein